MEKISGKSSNLTKISSWELKCQEFQLSLPHSNYQMLNVTLELVKYGTCLKARRAFPGILPIWGHHN